MKKNFNRLRGTVTLYFDNQVHAEYMMRGGVCWPEGEDGFAILAGQDVNNKKIHVFKQSSFLTVDNILRADRSIEYYGLSSFFNQSWSGYFGRDFFWNQDEEIHKRFRLQVGRSPMIEPKPQFIPAPYADERDANHLIFEYKALGKLKFDKDSELHRQLERLKHDEKAKLPAVHALRCLLAGYERYPFRNYDVEEDEVF